MRRILAVVIALCVLCGCTQSERCIDRALSLRESIINGNGCLFDVSIMADYQDICYTFLMNCQADSGGNIKFEVKEPESICGISGMVSSNEGKLTFDNQVLMFSTLADGQITPVSAPWLFLNALRSGYIKGCAQEEDGLLLQINDSYAEDAMLLNIRIIGDIPVAAEVIWQNQCVVRMNVESFRIL